MSQVAALLMQLCKEPYHFNCAATITYENTLVNRGRLYVTKTRFEARADPVVFHLRTGTKDVHSIPSLNAALKTKLDIIEGVTITADGTPEAMRNQNRNYADNGLIALLFVGSTYTGGTTIRQAQAGFGTSQGRSQSGPYGESLKTILKKNTNYIYLIAPAASTDFLFESTFWEEE